MLIDWIIVLVLVGISAFFSWSETAVVSCSMAKIHRLSGEGDKRAKRVEKLMKYKESLMGTILLCNNVVNILSSAIATSLLINTFGEAGIVYATIIMTVLILVIGEIAPKTHALKNAERVALASASILWVLVKILNPITKTIQKFIDSTMKIFAGKKKKEKLISDLDEIRGTIELKHKEGSMFKYDKDMIGSILDLGEVEIGNIVIHRKNIESINVDQDIADIIKQAFEIGHTNIPLWKKDHDNIVAILNMKKVVKMLHHNVREIKNISLESVTSEPWFVPSTNTLRNQLFSFRKKKNKFAVVVDEYGVVLGIITLEDILEEIVGEINDDNRREVAKIIKVKNDFYKVPGEAPIRDVNRKLNWELPEDNEVSTIAGFVVDKIERIPEEEEEFTIDGFMFKILTKENNKIILLKVKKIKEENIG